MQIPGSILRLLSVQMNTCMLKCLSCRLPRGFNRPSINSTNALLIGIACAEQPNCACAAATLVTVLYIGFSLGAAHLRKKKVVIKLTAGFRPRNDEFPLFCSSTIHRETTISNSAHLLPIPTTNLSRPAQWLQAIPELLMAESSLAAIQCSAATYHRRPKKMLCG